MTRRGMMLICVLGLPLYVIAQNPASSTDDVSKAELYSPNNLTAWLVMFTDAERRTPAERAQMVSDLGFTTVGFEAFKRYVPIFEEQLEEYSKRGIRTTSVYCVVETETPSEEEHVQQILRVLEKRKETPEVWVMFSRDAFRELSEDDRLGRMIEAFSDLATRLEKSGCKMALYNYGSWFGKVDTQLAIIEGVHAKTGIEIGTVLNFHRGHQHMANFPEVLRKMRPHLVAVNINGMNRKDIGYDKGAALILPVGEGDYEATMMYQLIESGYRGPIGVIDHRNGVDAEQALKENLEGIARIRSQFAASK